MTFSQENKGLKLEENNKIILKSSLEESEDDDNLILKAKKDITIDLYTLDNGYDKILQFPKNKLKIYQIQEGKNGKL